VFLPKETVELAEKAAEARNQTLDEYIEELTLRMIENAKKGGNKKLLIGSSVYETLEARAKIQDLSIEAYIELLINTTTEEGVQHAEN
jgi:predicted HicB family RNase H-like nuclease